MVEVRWADNTCAGIEFDDHCRIVNVCADHSVVKEAKDWAGSKRIVLDPDIPIGAGRVGKSKIRQVDEHSAATRRPYVEHQT